jgi:hypothetical protein
MRPSRYEPNDDDSGEGKIVEKTTQFPKADGVGEEAAKRARR